MVVLPYNYWHYGKAEISIVHYGQSRYDTTIAPRVLNNNLVLSLSLQSLTDLLHGENVGTDRRTDGMTKQLL